MGFDKAWVDISCDECGLESEPEELSRSSSLGGMFSLEEARVTLRRDGWLVDDKDRITCADCANPPEDDD